MGFHTAPDQFTPAEMMLAHLPVGVALFDARDLRLLQANPCFHASLDPEWQQGQAIGHSLTEFLPRAEHSGSIALFRQVAATGIPYQTEAYASSAFARGLTYWDWSLNPIRHANGQIVHLLLTLIDVTARVVAQQQAQQARTALALTSQALEIEQQRMKLLETLTQCIGGLLQPEHIARNALDALQTALHPLACALYVHDAAHQGFRALALTLPETSRSWRRRLTRLAYDCSSSLLQALQEPQTLLRTRLPASEDEKQPEMLFQAIPGAGTIVYLPLWYKKTCEGVLVLVFAQVLPEDAPLLHVVEGSTPLLAEILASAHLHALIDQQRQRFYTILDQLPEGVLLVEATEGTISYANPAASSLLGVPHATLVGTPLHRLEVSRLSQEPSSFPWHFALIHALWGKTINSQELVVKRADGSHAVLLSSTALLHLEAGENITEAMIAFQDITLQKTIEQQKSTFMAMVNHELRTPLTAVLGFCNLLQQHGMDGLNEMQAYAITSIVEQSEYLTYLVNEILDQSALEHVSFELHRTYQDLLPLLMQVIEQHKNTSQKHHIYLRTEGLSAQTRLMGQFDSYRVIQILNNVLTNALKYGPSGSNIEIGIRPGNKNSPERNTVLLWVKDQGPGIDPADLPHIFERFYRAEKRVQTVGGLGLGLYLAKELIQRHGGHIWAESTQGVGTTFFLTFPLSRNEIAYCTSPYDE